MPAVSGQTRSTFEADIAGAELQCPRCAGTLHDLVCTACFFHLEMHRRIWLALPKERAAYYSRFMADYERIRAAEGRGSQNDDYYLALPFDDLSGRNQQQWTIRARTFSYMVRHILPAIRERAGTAARILDMGAGNGWMSYRLSLMGFRPVAVDLLVNDQDGLGAARHYQHHLLKMFPRVQAETTHLPFASDQFDAVIFNASFHYAENYRSTVFESLRCLKHGGLIVIADSPWYARQSSGEAMLLERHAAFHRSYGTPSDSIASMEFLTDERLSQLEQMLSIKWERHNPYYGPRWTLRPLVARLHRRREPSRFRIYTTRKLA
jgi:SAM-dependent methyltransferase